MYIGLSDVKKTWADCCKISIIQTLYFHDHFTGKPYLFFGFLQEWII